MEIEETEMDELFPADWIDWEKELAVESQKEGALLSE